MTGTPVRSPACAFWLIIFVDVKSLRAVVRSVSADILRLGSERAQPGIDSEAAVLLVRSTVRLSLNNLSKTSKCTSYQWRENSVCFVDLFALSKPDKTRLPVFGILLRFWFSP